MDQQVIMKKYLTAGLEPRTLRSWGNSLNHKTNTTTALEWMQPRTFGFCFDAGCFCWFKRGHIFFFKKSWSLNISAALTCHKNCIVDLPTAVGRCGDKRFGFESVTGYVVNKWGFHKHKKVICHPLFNLPFNPYACSNS